MKIEALDVVNAKLLHCSKLLLRLDSLGDNTELHVLNHMHGSVHDKTAFLAAKICLGHYPVKFDDLNRHLDNIV